MYHLYQHTLRGKHFRHLSAVRNQSLNDTSERLQHFITAVLGTAEENKAFTYLQCALKLSRRDP